MAQVLKEEIYNRIKDAARDMFYSNGYKFTTMKNIAEKSGIPTGLIYSYFKNKEDLFSKVVYPAYSGLKSIIESEPVSDIPEENLFEYELPKFIKCISRYHLEIVILVDRSSGSLYSGFKDDLIDDVTRHLKKTPVLKDSSFDRIFYHILATNFMEGVFEIARHYVDPEWAGMMFRLLIKQHLYGTAGL